MTSSPSADPPSEKPSQSAEDPDLSGLPKPRRPIRRLTLVVMALTALLASAMAVGLGSDASYALKSGPPEDVGDLTKLSPGPSLDNEWVRGDGALSETGAIRYQRPLEDGSYRLAPIAGNDKLWIQVRVPSNMEGPRFVPPATFVGRLLPFSSPGLRHQGLPGALADAGETTPPPDAWLLLDGEAPSTTRWAVGLVALFIAFAGFNVYGLIHLLRPIRDA